MNNKLKNEYRYTKTTVSFMNYHIVFCPRYRRKIFLIKNLKKRFKKIVKQECDKMQIKIIAMECDKDHAHLFINALPQWTVPKILKQIKGVTSYYLRREFAELNKMPSLWTRSYFVSTAGYVSAETIKKYVEEQKMRYE